MSRYQPPYADRRRALATPSLPRGFTPIRQLLYEGLQNGTTVSVVGVVKDYRLPCATKGTDYKCTITLYDTSTQEDNDGININIFRKEAEMPALQAGDIVIGFMVKVQTFGGTPSLLSSARTDIHVFEAQRMPSCRASRSAWGALRQPTKKVSREPDAKENEYVLWLFDNIDKTFLPDHQEFSARAERSANIKDKFTLLQHVREHRFADLVIQVVREPFDMGDKMCLWVSDYTEHDSFFNRTRDGADSMDGVLFQDGDPYGYTNKFRRKSDPAVDEVNSKWVGPYGKKSIQMTCWEPHANFIREHVRVGDWIRLRNVQIGYGRNSVNIEGFLRGDREYPNRVCVDVLDPHADRETINPHLVEALRRKRDHEREEKQYRKTGEKRKAEDPPKKENNKTRRKRQRENNRKAIEEQEANQEAALDLNDLIKCENQDKDLVSLSTILEPVSYPTTINNQPAKLELPFTNAKYRTQVRVIDFHPASLKDFAVSRSRTEYDALSDNDRSDSDSTSSSTFSHKPYVKSVWEWRFALKVEEVSASRPKSKKPATVWVIVDNPDAQLLTGLDDAADLHANANGELLNILREQMFKLWGNLEERKSKIEVRRKQHDRDPLGVPPAEPLDVEDHTAAIDATGGGDGNFPGSSQLSNRPFTCCLRQYGIKLKADQGDTENAGEGWQWRRMFGMFGTKIVSD